MTAEDVIAFINECGERWFNRVQDPASGDIDPRSPLNESVLNSVTIAQMTWRLIADGGQHMAAHHVWVKAAGGGLWLKPSMTLGRTAAVCASRALYIMRGDTVDERRIHALQLMNDEADAAGQIASDSRARDSADAPGLTKEAADFKKQIATALESSGCKAGSKMSDTKLIADAAVHFPANEQNAADQLQRAWRVASGAAHGRSFVWDAQLEDMPIEQQLIAAWSIPAQLLEVAWDRWSALKNRDQN